mgnify:FL=1
MAQAKKVQAVEERGELWQNAAGFYWLPVSVVEEIDFKAGDFGSADKLDNLFTEREDVMLYWPNGMGETGATRGLLWSRLQAETKPRSLPYSEELRSSTTDNPRVPVSIAQEGKARIAAYLYVHKWSKTSIAQTLDVKTETVTQYVSDVKRGKR